MALQLRRKMRRLYKTLTGSHRRAADDIYKLRDLVLSGVLVAIDPGSTSLGFAVYNKGELIQSGTIKGKGKIGPRLNQMFEQLDLNADVCAVEFVRSSTGHIYLTWAAGFAVGAVGAEHTVEVHTGSWKKLVSSHYQKNDENDAIAIGRYVVEICKETE